MTAREATQDALAAVAAGDLDALSQALAARQNGLRIASRSELTDALRDGETLALRLADLKRTLAAEHARLEQLREGLSVYCASSVSCCIDLRA